jgi:hypothetical protein
MWISKDYDIRGNIDRTIASGDYRHVKWLLRISSFVRATGLSKQAFATITERQRRGG